MLDERAKATLGDITESTGFMTIVSEDDAFLLPVDAATRFGVPVRRFVTGDSLRDWSIAPSECVVFPYSVDQGSQCLEARADRPTVRHFWPYRLTLRQRLMFGKTAEQHGMAWYAFMHFGEDRFQSDHLIAFASVATHNQFCLRSGADVLNRHAPVIKLSATACEDDRLALLGLLNSSTACFWIKQVFHNKGSTVDQAGARQRTAPFEDFFEHDGTKLKQFPLPAERPLSLARQLDGMAGLLSELAPSVLLRTRLAEANREVIAERRWQWEGIRQQMIALQEELDWQCYRLYGLTDEDLTQRRKDAKEEEEEVREYPRRNPLVQGHRIKLTTIL
jgi:hypothetical protein